MQLHTLQSTKPTKAKPRVGRGGKRGKTSGHGHKGQKQHGRHGIRPEMRDFIKKLPKLRGHGKNRARTVNGDKTKPQIVKTTELMLFKSGETVTPSTMADKALVNLVGGKLPRVKIVSGNNELNIKLTVEGCEVSASAKEEILNAGGTIN